MLKFFKVKDGNKDNKMMSLLINDEKILKDIKPSGLKLKT